MIALRSAAIAASTLAIAYGLWHGFYPLAVLNAVLLPLNAVRLLQLKEVGRRDPKRAATELIPAHYVELVRRARGRVRPGEWTVRDFFRGVAGLGGFLGRKSDGEPGWMTIWRGWEVLHWMLLGAQLTTQTAAH